MTLRDQILLIGLGGFLGATTRYLITVYFSKFKLFPLATFIINISGSFLLGILAGNERLSVSISLFIGTGFLGAYTTFSTMNFELFSLKQSRRHFLFILYLVSSYCLGLLSAGIGYLIGKALFDR